MKHTLVKDFQMYPRCSFRKLTQLPSWYHISEGQFNGLASISSLAHYDVDECQEQSGVCEQARHNDHGSFHCHCQAGYSLGADRKTCLLA
ncbi:GAS6 protein, partial [Polyodon spathula]|nr:GAS6 protein [Polyodon spathula]